MKEAMRRLRNYGIFVSMLAVALLGSYQYLSGYTTVSNNVNGKEMPICSVETKEKKVALTFESAWGDEDIARILEILKKAGGPCYIFPDRGVGREVSGGCEGNPGCGPRHRKPQ